MLQKIVNSFILIENYSIILIPGILLILLSVKYFWAKRRPEMEFVIEIVILGAALHLALTMFWSAIEFCKTDTNKALGQFLGFVAVGFSSVFGVWRIFNSIHKQFEPKKPD